LEAAVQRTQKINKQRSNALRLKLKLNAKFSVVRGKKLKIFRKQLAVALFVVVVVVSLVVAACSNLAPVALVS